MIKTAVIFGGAYFVGTSVGAWAAKSAGIANPTAITAFKVGGAVISFYVLASVLG